MTKPVLAMLTLMSLLAAEQTWRDKPPSAWTAAEIVQILSDSPWVKKVTPTVERPPQSQGRPGGRRGGQIDVGGVGVGVPGLGGRRGGIGQGAPNGDPDTQTPPRQASSQRVPELILRWESAMPVRAAELKAPDVFAPTVDEDHYAIAVFGLPNQMVGDGSRQFAEALRDSAGIRRDGKKDMRPSSVEILMREEGAILLYLFPRTNEIGTRDGLMEFSAQIGRMTIKQPFDPGQMIFQGKLEL